MKRGEMNIDTIMAGSYIFLHQEEVLEISSSKLNVQKGRLLAHPDFYLVTSERSIGIDVIREVGYFLRIKPIASQYKILVIENFHLATVEAQNAFLKTFEEPPPYAYIFLVTPYIDRLLKTIISRAQVITGISNFETRISKLNQNSLTSEASVLRRQKFKIQNLLNMNIGERFLWLENEIKGLEDKVKVKVRLLEIVNAFLNEGLLLAKEGRVNLDAVEYLKEATWKIEQGFPNPKLLMEGFLVILRSSTS